MVLHKITKCSINKKKWVVNKKIRLCVCMCIPHIIIKDQELLKATKKES